MYAPAYPGATYGNVSVNFGREFPDPQNPSDSQIVNSRSAYGGAYQLLLMNMKYN